MILRDSRFVEEEQEVHVEAVHVAVVNLGTGIHILV